MICLWLPCVTPFLYILCKCHPRCILSGHTLPVMSMYYFASLHALPMMSMCQPFPSHDVCELSFSLHTLPMASMCHTLCLHTLPLTPMCHPFSLHSLPMTSMCHTLCLHILTMTLMHDPLSWHTLPVTSMSKPSSLQTIPMTSMCHSIVLAMLCCLRPRNINFICFLYVPVEWFLFNCMSEIVDVWILEGTFLAHFGVLGVSKAAMISHWDPDVILVDSKGGVPTKV